MDETALRARLERAISDEPPLGHLVSNALRAGHRLRRRRRTGAASLSAAAVVLIGVVPALTVGAGHHLQPSASQAGRGTTAYIHVEAELFPVDLATQTAGKPIAAPGVSFSSLDGTAVITPDGRTVYALGTYLVTPIDTATKKAGAPIRLTDAGGLNGIALAPDGKTIYVAGSDGVVPISTATNTRGKLIDSVQGGWWQPTLTPNGKLLYLLNRNGRWAVGVIRTARNAVGRSIPLPALPNENRPRMPTEIVFTPDSKTAYVLETEFGGTSDSNLVVPITVATSTPRAPIKIRPAGATAGLVMAPDGRTLYVLSSRSVIPISTATNRAEPAIRLPKSAGYANHMIDSPNGTMLYVLTGRGVLPIETASDKVLPLIDAPRHTTFTRLAITPDGRTLCVGAYIWRRKKMFGHWYRRDVGGGVVPITAATGTVGRLISLGNMPSAIVFGR